MATLDDLNFESIVDMSQDDAIESLRQIRLSRRMPAKKKVSNKKAKAKAVPKVSPNQAKNLLKILEDLE